MIATNKMITFLMAGVLFLGGCGRKESMPAPATPLEALECTMESIKNLDMETLNQYTDNYVQTYHNWIGVPIENEYHVFNELLQPHSEHSKRYQSSYELDQKMFEKLEWEITDVRENSDTAEIDLTITNIDLLKVMETYETSILENMLESPGTGIAQLIRDTITVKDNLITIIDDLDDGDISTINVTVSAYQDNGQWKIHLSHDFINAFSGNMYADNTEDIDQQIAELEEQVTRKADQWAEQFESNAIKWAEQFE